MYCRGLGLQIVGRFENHDGFDGVMLGLEGSNYHLEFTFCRIHPVTPAPTPEDLLVFYLPAPDDWKTACDKVLAAGFERTRSFNPFWEMRGRTFRDQDGYRIVLQGEEWD
jgi:hypothetical protein